MTDYLMLLLDIWQDEDEVEPFVWKRAGKGYHGLDGKGETRLSEDREHTMTGTDEARTPGRRRWGSEVRAQNTTADPETQLAMLERAVARGKAPRVGLGRRHEAVVPTQGDHSWTAGGTTMTVPEGHRGLAGMLDVAFERDARRYDGPLGLF